MRNRWIAAPLVLTLFAAGCGPVVFLHPLYTQSSAVFDPALLGVWTGEGDLMDDTWTFEKSGGHAFTLIDTPKGEQSYRFDVHLVRLDQFLFLDASRQDDTVPTHILGRVWIEGDILRVALLDEDWLHAALSRKAVAPRYELLGDGQDGDQMVLTGSTAELQKLMVTCALSATGFSGLGELHRQK